MYVDWGSWCLGAGLKRRVFGAFLGQTEGLRLFRALCLLRGA